MIADLQMLSFDLLRTIQHAASEVVRQITQCIAFIRLWLWPLVWSYMLSLWSLAQSHIESKLGHASAFHVCSVHKSLDRSGAAVSI